jgi:GTP-binding protein LepA
VPARWVRHFRHQGTEAAKVGDTITTVDRKAAEPLPGFKEIKPQVFAGLYPVESNQYDSLRESLEKLKLNDASLQYEPEVSQALGFGFRCGFLGLLHMEIVQERLEREFDQDLITTAPTVVYEVVSATAASFRWKPGQAAEIRRSRSREPIITATIFVPQDYLGNVITLCNQKRGNQVDMHYHGRQVKLVYEMPMAEVVMDFFDKLKSCSKAMPRWTTSSRNTVRRCGQIGYLINSEKVDALSLIVHRPTRNTAAANWPPRCAN